jgi:hypothetical protein
MTLTPLGLLHAEYAQLAHNNTSKLTSDQRRSSSYYLAELAVSSSQAATRTGTARVGMWIRSLLDLEEFIATEGRWPKENNRAPKSAFSSVERRLVAWVRRERQATATSARCSYQLARLQCVPGYATRPMDDRWDHRLNEYERFTLDRGRAPRLRSVDEVESSLAGWAAKQRLLFRKGRLPLQRINTLEALDFWAWGSRRQ